MIQPCNSRNFYYFPLDPHLNHQNLDKDHCNFPVKKKGKNNERMAREKIILELKDNTLWNFAPERITTM